MSTSADWLEQARRLLEGLTAPHPPEDGADGADDSGDRGVPVEGCRYCPHCQVAAVLRGDRPEVSAALADILTATSNALKTFAAGGTPPEPSGPAAEPAPDEPEAEPPPDVQRIELA